MSDPIESQSSRQLAEAAASPASHDAPAAQPAKEPDLASLLSEFEASTATPKPEPQAPQADPAQATPTPAVDPIAAGMAGFDDLARAHRLETENRALTQEVQAARHYIDNQHFDQAVTAGEKMLADAELFDELIAAVEAVPFPVYPLPGAALASQDCCWRYSPVPPAA
jgi:hypothetical protein